MIEQTVNSIMITANCHKYFGHPQSAIGSSSAATKNISANNNSMMSNSLASGATNSVPSSIMMNNNNNTSNTKSNGMSSSVGSSSSSVNGVCGSANPSQQQPAIANKMGSRRIFSPHFKLLVLESYRNDSDCKGNQRATARKYGIHRRQIQKWLQCETALRTSVSAGGATSPSNSSNTSSASPNSSGGGYNKSLDSNNNHQQKRTPKSTAAASTLLSTSSNHQARHCVVAEPHESSNGAVRVTAVAVEEHSRLMGGCRSMGEAHMNTLTQQPRLDSTHTRQNSMEFFSSTTTLIINGHGAAGEAGGSTMMMKVEREEEDRKMNEAAVPIKPEFRFNAVAAAPPPPSHHHHHPSMNRGVEMPSTAAMLNHHRHHHHHQEDAPHHSLVGALPPFISTIYGPAGLLAFPTPRLTPFGFDYPTLRHLSPSIPIDLSMGNTERRHAGELRHSDRLIHADDARVPTRSSSGDVIMASHPSPLSPVIDASTSSPMDLSCGSRKRQAACPLEPAKPPKLFKPYLLDEKEEEEDLKVVDENDDESLSTTTSLKGDSFLDQDLTGLKDRPGPRFEYPTVWSHHHQQQQYYHPGSSPTYDNFYYGHESLTLYPSPRQYRYESQSSLSPSAASSPLHHPSRPASLFDSSTSSEGTFSNYHPLSPASSEVRSSPPVFNLDLKLQSVQPPISSAWQEIRSRVGAVF